MAIAMAQINEVPPALPEGIDPRLVRLVMDCLAKKPDLRPRSALELAARAEALVADTPAHIPINTVIPSGVEPVSDETTLITTDTKPTATVPAIWPWISVILILLSTIAVIVWAGLVAPKTPIDPSPSPSNTKTDTPTPTPTPTPTETVDTVVVLVSDYEGLDVSLVVPKLSDLGLVVEPVAGTSVPADDPRISQVYDISPLGTLEIGSTITVYYYQQIVDPNTVIN
jgi:serine/threonine-protein kinase